MSAIAEIVHQNREELLEFSIGYSCDFLCLYPPVVHLITLNQHRSSSMGHTYYIHFHQPPHIMILDQSEKRPWHLKLDHITRGSI